ncbi:hypothetical protein [Actinoallomurus soli]|uniref:hypothetical protein n=1 Tax=Actinoallomurus soli TaxID=2952535 RepID=UPI002092B9CE|nr:hypothetical protein [Actinoallomurus soli]MCO5971791.1 hypothetical protein [Actinoallomurus soli]
MLPALGRASLAALEGAASAAIPAGVTVDDRRLFGCGNVTVLFAERLEDVIDSDLKSHALLANEHRF